ncbi:uncharacterized protein LOC118460430 [Anopheles albimanus]|uniref:uncharacterized protein LOC118460430 n=1 Tax=Anopheles albimanus TaxID=7167 RepID=UPI001640D079|nr:uncharacterized protein LOC118460430 [Anopheles albimanus]
MSDALKEQTLKIDSKLNSIRRQVTAFAIGYREKNDSKEQDVRKALTAVSSELRERAANCDSLILSTQTLDTLLAEADKAADEIYDRVLELYQQLGVEVPSFDLETIPVGFPIEQYLPIDPEPTASDDEDPSTETPPAEEDSLPEGDNSSASQLEELASEIYISRPPGEEGLAPETPMIKTRKRLF